MLQILAVGVIALLFLITKNFLRKISYKSKGILYLGDGNWRLLKNSIRGVSLAKDVAAQYGKIKLSQAKVGVSNDFGLTTVTIGDPELLKSIMVKDFEHFADRRQLMLGKDDYIFRKMVFLTVGDTWKNLRAHLSPTFTTGKIKRMFKIFDQSAQKFVKFLQAEIQNSDDGQIDIAQAYSKITMEIIASAACGVDCGAFKQKGDSVFETIAREIRFNIGASSMIKMLALALMPSKLTELMNISLFRKDVQDFFMKTITGLIKGREATGEKREDFVQLMMEARAGKLRVEDLELDAYEKNALLPGQAQIVSTEEILDEEGIVANCLIFILAGFDTTQSLLLFCAYSLALNPDVQERLREEVTVLFEENGNDQELKYDTLNGIPYLEMVLNETLRLFPPAPSYERCCTLDYKLPGGNLTMKKGEIVSIPVYGLHHDPDLYPEPEKFDPERFSYANRYKIHPYSFLPFGQGPRNCIGMRFAMTEAKVVIAYLVHHFRIETSEKTMIPMKFSNDLALKPFGGMHLRLHKI